MQTSDDYNYKDLQQAIIGLQGQEKHSSNLLMLTASLDDAIDSAPAAGWPQGGVHWRRLCTLRNDLESLLVFNADLRAQTLRKASGRVSEFLSLGQAHAATYRVLVEAGVANPQAQVQLAALLEQLQLVAYALRCVVGEQELMAEEVQGTHGQSPVVKAAIVGESCTAVQGGAA